MEAQDLVERRVEYRNFKVIGPVGALEVEAKTPGGAHILLIGMTGSGKSTFIEACGNNSDLGISKDQLEGFTQVCHTYALKNIDCSSDSHPPCLVDTPGFSDRKLSELSVVKMIQDHLRTTNRMCFNAVMYFDRITDTRVPGSKKRIHEMLKGLIGPERSAATLTIVTTMWDQIPNDDKLVQANMRYAQLQKEHWKEFIDNGSRIVKFTNTQDSALDIIDEALSTNSDIYLPIEQMVHHHQTLKDTPFGYSLYRNLQERLGGLYQQHGTIGEELNDPHLDEYGEELKTLLMKQKGAVEKDLQMFEKELDDFGGRPPSPPPLKPSTPPTMDIRDKLKKKLGDTAKRTKVIFRAGLFKSNLKD